MAFAKYDGPTIDKVLNNPESKFYKQLAAAYDKAGFPLYGHAAERHLPSCDGQYQPEGTSMPIKALKSRTMSNKNHMAF